MLSWLFIFFDIDIVSILVILFKSGMMVIDWILVIKALEKLDIGIVSPLSLVSTVIVMFASYIIFKEALSLGNILSLIFIGGGVVLISFLEKGEKKNA